MLLALSKGISSPLRSRIRGLYDASKRQHFPWAVTKASGVKIILHSFLIIYPIPYCRNHSGVSPFIIIRAMGIVKLQEDIRHARPFPPQVTGYRVFTMQTG